MRVVLGSELQGPRTGIGQTIRGWVICFGPWDPIDIKCGKRGSGGWCRLLLIMHMHMLRVGGWGGRNLVVQGQRLGLGGWRLLKKNVYGNRVWVGARRMPKKINPTYIDHLRSPLPT